MDKKRTYIAIDLKSFYASVECVERGLDPLNANLVVADAERTDKTICLAVSPALKSFGVPGRARLFEANQVVEKVNAARSMKIPGREFKGASIYVDELEKDPSLKVDFVIAPPHMRHYMEVSSYIYELYLKYIAPEDIHVYSIDEVFIDATDYMKLYHVNAHDLTMMLIREVLTTTGITATAGIGSNMFLCKIAMDIEAKHSPADKDGVRIAELTEQSFREKMWNHTPLTDFWRIGHGIAAKLNRFGMFTLGDVARCSLNNEDLLYELFGVNAELLIDHAWGYEPCTMKMIKDYKPEGSSLSSGQVLTRPYPFDQARTVAREMAVQMAYDLVEKKLFTDQITLSVGYDNGNLEDPHVQKVYKGEIVKDYYGRLVPKSVHASSNLPSWTDSASLIEEAVADLFDRLVNKDLTVRRMYIGATHVKNAKEVAEINSAVQMDLFSEEEETTKVSSKDREKEKRRQEAILAIRERFGKNAVVLGMNLEEGATTIQRNAQVGGHKA